MSLKNLFLVVIFYFLVVPASFAASLRDGLILQYSFDSNTGSSIPDLSGAGHNGQVNGAVFNSSGKFGGAYSFDGKDDYILAGNLGYQPTGTISFWMKAAALENYRNPFSTDFASWDDNIRFESAASGEFSGGGHGLGRGDVYMKTMEPGRWYHVVYAWDEQYVYGYLDGKLRFRNPHPDASAKVHPDLPLTAGEYKQTTLAFANVAIGNGYSTEPGRFWRGLIDEVRIYNRPLTALEVKWLHQGRGDGLVLHYSFDSNDAEVVKDQSGLGNDASVRNGAAHTADGRIGPGFRFDGFDDYLLVRNDKSLNVAGELTVALWFLPEATAEASLLEWGNVSAAGVHMRTRAAGSQWNSLGTGVNFVDIAGDQGSHVISVADPALNQWHHLAATYSRTSGRAVLYLDGIPVLEKSMGAFMPATAGALTIGRSLFGGGNFSGRLDEVRVYNRALSPAEVRAMVDSLTHGKIYQDFENNNGTGDEYGWAINASQGVTVSRTTERKSAGTYSWKMTVPASLSAWTGGTAVKARVEQWHLNAEVHRHDRLSFRLLARPQTSAPQTVKVKFFDHGKYVWDPASGRDGATVTVLNQAAAGVWSVMDVLFTQLPVDFNPGDIDKIEIYVQGAGTFYFDDIVITSADRVYQAFEKRAGITVPDPAEYGWAWNGSAALTGSLPAQGALSWQLKATNLLPNWAGTGIKYQGKNFTDAGQAQDIWNVALLPRGMHSSLYATLALSVKQLGQNGLDNNIQAVFFDHASCPAGSGCELWTTRRGAYNEWTRFGISLNLLPAGFNFQDLDKIEFGLYWPGTYLFDDIRVVKYSPLRIDESYLSGGMVTWNEVPGAVRYVVERSDKSARGPWLQVYSGSDSLFKTDSLAPAWFRVRWESDANSQRGTVAYVSDWSETARYIPRPVLIAKDRLDAGSVEWNFIPQAPFYQVQSASDRFGPWTTIYEGPFQVTPLSARAGYWYQVRGLQKNNTGAPTAYGEWSPALLYDRSAYVTADGTALRQKKGSGRLLKLRGVNLGNYLLMEPWMLFGSNSPLITSYPDDYSIRSSIKTRFGQSGLDSFLKTYRAAYVQESDFDSFMRNGFNLVRLPVNVQDIRPLDDNGNWTTSSFRFEYIDRVIRFCADRGLYVLLDLHGAPGYQSREFHSGRREVNRLFDPATDVFRQRTVELWTALARRYRSNTTVLGYDLINEPFGAVTPEYYPVKEDGYRALWALYDRIYKAIRSAQSSGGAGDTQHLIVLEGIPSPRDWETLPSPAAFGWQNVMYQHHYYGFTYDGDGNINGTMTYEQHQEYLNDKVRNSRQASYNVPVLIGEFNGFGEARIWNLLVNTFNARGWHWAVWSHKVHDSSSEWGLFSHSLYDDTEPDPGVDSLETLLRKASRYATDIYHKPYQALQSLLKKAAERPGYIHNLSASAKLGAVALSWSAPDSASASTAYQVQFGAVQGNTWDQLWLDDARPGTVISGLVPGKAYQFRVRALSVQGAGPWSNIVRITAM